MRILTLAIGAVTLMTIQAAAADADSRFEKSLKLLEPGERLEQLCDYTALTHIRKDQPGFRPERAVANATKDARVKNDTIDAKGAAFRSRGKWYAMSYVCKGAPDHLSVESFHYSVGNEIPEAKWASFGLWQ